MVNMQSMNEHHLSLIPLFYMSTRIRRKSFREFWPKTQFEVSRTSNLCWGKSLKPWDDALPITKSSNVVMFVKRDRTERVIKTSSPFKGDGFIRQKCGTIVSRTHNPVENETQVCKKKGEKSACRRFMGASSNCYKCLFTPSKPIILRLSGLHEVSTSWRGHSSQVSNFKSDPRPRQSVSEIKLGALTFCVSTLAFWRELAPFLKTFFFGFISHAVQQTQ